MLWVSVLFSCHLFLFLIPYFVPYIPPSPNTALKKRTASPVILLLLFPRLFVHCICFLIPPYTHLGRLSFYHFYRYLLLLDCNICLLASTRLSILNSPLRVFILLRSVSAFLLFAFALKVFSFLLLPTYFAFKVITRAIRLNIQRA